MAKQMLYFNATKQIETVTIHYNQKIDGTFVEDVCKYIKEISKKMTKINLKQPREYESIKVFVYPSVKMFNQIFGGVIEKRYYNRRRSLEDFYVVQDSEGNIHIASPRGKSQEKVEALKKILVMKVLGEYMDEKDKQMADKMLKASMMKKQKDEEEKEKEQEQEEIEEEIDEEEQELDEEDIEELEEEEQELDEEELEQLIETENQLAEIEEKDVDEKEEQEEEQVGEIPTKVVEAREWLSVGWMDYLSGRLSKEKYVKYFADHISKNGVKKLGKLKDSDWYERYNYSREYAAAIVDYVIATYGTKKLVEFYENPTDYKHVFGTTKLRFEQEAKAYIYSKYGPARMQEEIEERDVDEVMHVSLDNNGGAAITTVGEDEEERTVETSFILSLDDKI